MQALCIINLLKYPHESRWDEILRRPVIDNRTIQETVGTILNDVKNKGDRAVKDYSFTFDQVSLTELQISNSEIAEAEKLISAELKEAILKAKENIEKFHAAQKVELPRVETTPGVVCWQKAIAIEKVGLYIPGGTAPLFSTVLMLAVPAKIAGCKEIILCTPPNKEGKINPAILFAASISGIDKIFKAGGAQAIGAMAYGTESIPKVYKIFGPGNQYVTLAKQLVSLQDVAIDMPAGPSEVEVIADDTAKPEFVAADLLSQAEHGVDSQSVLLTNSVDLAEKVIVEIEKQLENLPKKDIAVKSLANSFIVVLQSQDEIVNFTNRYAPEHLIIETSDYNELADRIVNAGSIFLGHFTPESAGDYASGTNHTLPTNGYARAFSGVNLDSFLKKITFQEISEEGIKNLGETIQILAEHESLHAHKNAVTLRMPVLEPTPAEPEEAIETRETTENIEATGASETSDIADNTDKINNTEINEATDAKEKINETDTTDTDTDNDTDTISITSIEYGSPEYIEMCKLRDEVLRKPIGLQLTEEETLRDVDDVLIVCLLNEEVIACCILTENDQDTVQLRQMAVSPSYQKIGLGKEILLYAEQIAEEIHYSKIRMHARKSAIDFYSKAGYTIVGEEFTEVGIPHFEMEKKI